MHKDVSVGGALTCWESLEHFTGEGGKEKGRKGQERRAGEGTEFAISGPWLLCL